MKKMKKIFALLLALTMVLGMSTTVFAAGGDTQNGTGTITVNNASKKAGKYVEATDGKFKFDEATKTYVEIKEGENVTGKKYNYTEEDNAYTAYRIFQASPADNGDDKGKPTSTWAGEGKNNVSYTATAAQVQALKTSTDVYEALPTTVGQYVTGAGQIFKFTLTANGDYLVTLMNGKKAADVAAYFNANYTTLKANSTAFPSYDMTIDESAKTAVTGQIPYGYYFVSSSQGAVVSVDTTNNSVVINDKNSYADPFNPGDDDNPTDNDLKNIVKINGEGITVNHDNTSANIGDILEYEIKNNTSNYVVKDGTSKKVSYVYINDTIGKGLKYVTTLPFTVKVGNAELTRNAGEFTTQDPTAPKYYIVEKTEATGESYDGDAFTVIIPWLDANGDPVFADNAVVTVNYSAQLDEYVDEVAGNEGGANSSNKADVKYDLVDPDGVPENPPTDPTPGQGGTETGVKEDEVRVFVYAIAIQKYDGKDQAALEGAHFEVKDSTGKVIIAKEAAGTEKRYMFDSTKQKEYDESTTNPKTVPAGYTKDFKTNSDGQIIIYGVKEGTYTVIETVAPAGYNLMADSATIDASVGETKVTTTTITIETKYVQADDGIYKKVTEGGEDKFVLIGANETVAAADRYAKADENASNPITATTTFDSAENVAYVGVENNAGSELPSTGGIGTTIFYVLGSALVIFAGVVLVTRRRMSVN